MVADSSLEYEALRIPHSMMASVTDGGTSHSGGAALLVIVVPADEITGSATSTGRNSWAACRPA
jgi:hypothetical protein